MTNYANAATIKMYKKTWNQDKEHYMKSDKILEFLRSRLKEDYEERDLRRATDALLRRGHSYQEIRKAMQELAFDEDFREEY